VPRVLVEHCAAILEGPLPAAWASLSRKVSTTKVESEWPTERYQSVGTPGACCQSMSRFGMAEGMSAAPRDGGGIHALLDDDLLERRAGDEG
jgi:hypothetical protein